MKTNSLLTLLAVAAIAFPFAASAQKDKKPSIGNFQFWPSKGDSKTGPYVPGLNAALQLSDEQIQKLHDAQRETLGGEALQEAGRKVKGNENATEAEREAVRRLYNEAQAKLQERIAKVLTDAQRSLIEKISAAYQDSLKAGMDTYQTQFANVKGNKADSARLQEEFREHVGKDLMTRLTGILTADQRGAMAKAAEEEKAAAALPKVKK